MNKVSETVSDSAKYLGQGFILAYYLPALVWVMVHVYLWDTTLFDTLISENTENLNSLISVLFLPLIGGIILLVLNNIIIRLFEGMPFLLREVLLYPLTNRNRKYCKKFYSELVRLQQIYRQTNIIFWQTRSPNKQSELKKCLNELAQEIQKQHEAIEGENPSFKQIIPHNLYRVCPTSFGNAFAVAEEYSYERYGIDSVLFWSRLRQLMQDQYPTHSTRLTQQKTLLDLSINFAFIFGLLAIEAIITLLFDCDPWLLFFALISLILFVSFYKASVAAVQVLGELIKISFDYYRQLILQAFNLEMPDNIREEQVIWEKLAAFIRRGEVFYFPEEVYNFQENHNKSIKHNQ